MDPRESITLRTASFGDAEVIARLGLVALASNPVSRALHGPTGTSAAAQARVQRDTEAALHSATRDPHITYVVAERPVGSDIPSLNNEVRHSTEARVADGVSRSERDAAKKVVGYAKWHFYPTEASSASFKAADPGTSDPLVATFFIGGHELRQRNIKGRPCAIVTLLAVDPSCQGQGAGRQLAEWGTQRADAAGLDCWLICTPAAHRLYENCGYYDVDLMDVDLRKLAGIEKLHAEEDWGEGLAHHIREEPDPGHYRAVLMRRDASGAIVENGKVPRYSHAASNDKDAI